MVAVAQPRRVFVGLGSNLGASVETLRAAVALIEKLPQCSNLKASSVYRSAPFETTSAQPDYFNAVVAFDTTLDTDSLWSKLVAIETKLGRERTAERNAARVIDIDLLIVGNEQRATTTLNLPHPRMTERAFVLLPLIEIEPRAHIASKGAATDYIVHVKHQPIELVKNLHLCN
jgi:2-amino-4-hydroxy-6-hydroxymethyldihydropteridine diphosphokinase